VRDGDRLLLHCRGPPAAAAKQLPLIAAVRLPRTLPAEEVLQEGARAARASTPGVHVQQGQAAPGSAADCCASGLEAVGGGGGAQQREQPQLFDLLMQASHQPAVAAEGLTGDLVASFCLAYLQDLSQQQQDAWVRAGAGLPQWLTCPPTTQHAWLPSSG
jgi:hypothetical protein